MSAAERLENEGCELPQMPRTRGDCIDGPRPCPWVRCRHHLAIDIMGRRVVETYPGMELDDMGDTCSLDVADKGAMTLEYVSLVMGVTRERVRQLEVGAQESVARYARRFRLPLAELAIPDPGSEREE